MANGRAGLRHHPKCWWFKESTLNNRKIVSDEIHHPEEVRPIATAVGQRKQSAWTKWESTKDRAVTWGNHKHMNPQKLSFLIKAVYNFLLTPVSLYAWGLIHPTNPEPVGKLPASNIFSLDMSML